MKKKRKKTASPFIQANFEVSGLMKPIVELRPSLGSAPDVPIKYDVHNDALHSCFLFAEKLFGLTKDCQIEDEILLRSFVNQLSEKVSVRWNTVQIGERLFIHIPSTASRDSFVNLLDYFEENLDVSMVIACIERNSQNFVPLVKAFRFIGFDHVPPEQALPWHAFSDDSIVMSPMYHYLGYELDWAPNLQSPHENLTTLLTNYYILTETRISIINSRLKTRYPDMKILFRSNLCVCVVFCAQSFVESLSV